MIKFILLLAPLSLLAQLHIAVSYPYIGSLVKTIAGDKVQVSVLSKGNWDPHFVVPKPSLIAKMRRVDGIILNGSDLEIGWLPALVKKSANFDIQKESIRSLNLSQYVNHIHIPDLVSRSKGDVHPHGNPHFHLDPHNILLLSSIICEYLMVFDASNADVYDKNYEAFEIFWKNKLEGWKLKMQDKKGLKVIQYHDVLAYFIQAYSLETLATIEPLPGIAPSSKHIASLIQTMKENKVKLILQDVYHSAKTAKYLASKTEAQLVVVPHDIGSFDSIQSLESLFDTLVESFQ